MKQSIKRIWQRSKKIVKQIKTRDPGWMFRFQNVLQLSRKQLRYSINQGEKKKEVIDYLQNIP